MQLVRLAVRRSDLKNLNLEIGEVGNKAVDTDLQAPVPCSSRNALSLISKVYFPHHLKQCSVLFYRTSSEKKDHQERHDCQF
jgi:hypothetical protein